MLQAFRNAKQADGTPHARQHQAARELAEESEHKRQQYIREFLAESQDKTSHDLSSAYTPKDTFDARDQLTDSNDDFSSGGQGTRGEASKTSPEEEKQHTAAPRDTKKNPLDTFEERKCMYVRESLTESQSATLSDPPVTKATEGSPEKKRPNHTDNLINSPEDNFEARKHVYVVASDDCSENKQQHRASPHAAGSSIDTGTTEPKTKKNFQASRVDKQDEALHANPGGETPDRLTYAHVVDSPQEEEVVPVYTDAKSAERSGDSKRQYTRAEQHHRSSSDDSSMLPANDTIEETRKRYIGEFLAESQDAYEEFPVYSAVQTSSSEK